MKSMQKDFSLTLRMTLALVILREYYSGRILLVILNEVKDLDCILIDFATASFIFETFIFSLFSFILLI